MGSFKYPLIFCLHDYRLNDRERSGFYMMDVISAIEKTVALIPPEAASGYRIDDWPILHQTEYRAAKDKTGPDPLKFPAI